jgi:hypothetical protein
VSDSCVTSPVVVCSGHGGSESIGSYEYLVFLNAFVKIAQTVGLYPITDYGDSRLEALFLEACPPTDVKFSGCLIMPGLEVLSCCVLFLAEIPQLELAPSSISTCQGLGLSIGAVQRLMERATCTAKIVQCNLLCHLVERGSEMLEETTRTQCEWFHELRSLLRMADKALRLVFPW